MLNAVKESNVPFSLYCMLHAVWLHIMISFKEKDYITHENGDDYDTVREIWNHYWIVVAEENLKYFIKSFMLESQKR